MKCGNLNVIGPHNVIGSDTIRRCNFVRVGMALLCVCILRSFMVFGFHITLKLSLILAVPPHILSPSPLDPFGF